MIKNVLATLTRPTVLGRKNECPSFDLMEHSDTARDGLCMIFERKAFCGSHGGLHTMLCCMFGSQAPCGTVPVQGLCQAACKS